MSFAARHAQLAAGSLSTHQGGREFAALMLRVAA